MNISTNDFNVIDFLIRNFSQRFTIRNISQKLNASPAGIHKVMKKLEKDVVVTAKDNKSADFVSRCFAPSVGIPEDPVTGSSHCALVPYWAKKLKKTYFQALQLSKRGGELYCEYLGDRVIIGGKAVTFSVGRITLEKE